MEREPTPLADAFLDQGSGAFRTWPTDRATLEESLRSFVREAKAAWPSITIDDVAFVRHVASYASDPGVMGRMRAGDLLLAFACACGEDTALRSFERVHGTEMRQLAERLVPPALAEEVVQTLHQQLLVATEDRDAGIAKFSGQGKLRGWLRVTTVREAVRIRKKKGLEVPGEVEALEAVGTEGADPELRYMKALYKAEFRQAFVAGLSNLSPRERTLLRYTVIDGLTVDRVGAIYRVHRATAARWVSAARENLVAQTRRELMRRLAVGAVEQESILRLIVSDLDLSIRSLLREEAG